jgi:LuxR family transcriptional regulator, maltose regulon positive regulatory protein
VARIVEGPPADGSNAPAPRPDLAAARRQGLIERDRLVSRLGDAGEFPVVTVTGGAGWGKTTLLSQWCEVDERHHGWISATAADNDPAVFLGRVAAALGDDTETAEVPGGLGGLDAVKLMLRSVCASFANRRDPFLLVVDDIDRITSPATLEVVHALAEAVPPGSQLGLGARAEPPLPLARMRADRVLFELDPTSLAMDTDEGSALLGAAGVELSRSTTEYLMERTEGWPVGLYLAALVVREAADTEEAARAFAGDDRMIADYVRDELLGSLTPEVREFLTRTSILNRLCGPLCDAVLGADGSTEALEQMARSNLMLVPLDRRGEWYRYHHLFEELLRSDLHRREPDRVPVLHARATEWLAGTGDLSAAIEHARFVEDAQAFDVLLWRAGPGHIGQGRTATVRRWLDWFPPDVVAERPVRVLLAAWAALTEGDMTALEQWAVLAEHFGADPELPDGVPFRAGRTLLRALLAKDGIDAMRRDAALARDLDRAPSPFRAVACFLEGTALRLQGDDDAAIDRLAEGVAIGQMLGPATQAQCLGSWAVLEAARGSWEDARRHVDHALAIVDEFALSDRPAQAEVFAAAAFVHAHSGHLDAAHQESKQAQWLLSMLGGAAPWAAIEARLLIARCELLLGDVASARALREEAETLLASLPDSGVLVDRLADVRRMTDSESFPLGVTASPVTPAEMRVLRYLPTHLSFAAIADELFVSRNTVKTHAICVYRKLGVTSRGAAVEVARDLGLLEA